MSLLASATQWLEVITYWLIQPILILFLGIFLGKVLEQVLLFFVEEFAPERGWLQAIAFSTSWIVGVLALGYALHTIGLLGGLLKTLGLIVAVLLVINIVLGVSDFLQNFWRFRAVQARVRRGAKLRTRYGACTVVAVQLADTHLKTASGEDLYIPNRTMRSLKSETLS